MVSAVNVSWDFEDGKLPSWTAIYDNANMSIESEDNGNKYLKLSYNGKANRDRKYYDVKVTDVNSKGILQADYDIMYSNTDTIVVSVLPGPRRLMYHGILKMESFRHGLLYTTMRICP